MRVNKRGTVCHYNGHMGDCQRQRLHGWTMCPAHKSAGGSMTHYRMLKEQRAKSKRTAEHHNKMTRMGLQLHDNSETK